MYEKRRCKKTEFFTSPFWVITYILIEFQKGVQVAPLGGILVLGGAK